MSRARRLVVSFVDRARWWPERLTQRVGKAVAAGRGADQSDAFARALTSHNDTVGRHAKFRHADF